MKIATSTSWCSRWTPEKASTAQLAAAIEWFTTMACRDATLWVLDTNAGPRRFYEALGWTTDGTRKPVEIGGRTLTEVRYRRVL